MKRRIRLIGVTAVIVGLLIVAFGAQAFAAGPTPTSGQGASAPTGACSTLLQVAAEKMGVTVQDVYQGMHNGQSIMAQAAAKGVSKQAILDAFKAKEQTRLNGMVQKNWVTANQLGSMLDMQVYGANWMLNSGPGWGSGWNLTPAQKDMTQKNMTWRWNYGMMWGTNNGGSSLPLVTPFQPGMMQNLNNQTPVQPAAPATPAPVGPNMMQNGNSGAQAVKPGTGYGSGMMQNYQNQTVQPAAPQAQAPAAPQAPVVNPGTGMMGGQTTAPVGQAGGMMGGR